MFSALSAAFFAWPGFRLFCARLAVHHFAFSLVSGLKIKLNFNSNGNKYNGCLSVRYNPLFTSLLLFTKSHKTMLNSHILHI